MGYGQPRMRQMIEDIEAKGGEAWVFEQIAEGRTVESIGRDLGVSRGMLYRWKNAKGHKERRSALWKSAQKQSAPVLLEQGLDALDGLTKDEEGNARVPQAAEVSAVREQAGYRKYLAGLRDPAFIDPSKGAAVNLNFNVADLHLQALQAPTAQAEPVEAIEGEDYEVEEVPATGGEVPSLPEPTTAPSDSLVDELADLL